MKPLIIIGLSALFTFFITGCKVETPPEPVCHSYSSFFVAIRGIDTLLHGDCYAEVYFAQNTAATYSYNWSNGSTVQYQHGLANGTYTVTVTSSAGAACTGTASVTITGSGSSCSGTIADAESNIYNIVSIGSQCWMAVNLNTSSGAGIPLVANDSQWADSSNSGGTACCYYNNADNGVGKLYNWNAVVTGNICPAGWHIPTEAEWQILINYLGGDSVAGGKMKATSGWNAPNSGATNSSGFRGTPGGARSPSGNFYGIDFNGNYWTSTVGTMPGFAKVLILDTYTEGTYFTVDVKGAGYSCRCVKD